MKKICILAILFILSFGYAYGEIIQITNYPTEPVSIGPNLFENYFVMTTSLTSEGQVFWWKNRRTDIVGGHVYYWSCYYYDGSNIIEVQSEIRNEPRSMVLGAQKTGNWFAYMLSEEYPVWDIYLSNGITKTKIWENILPNLFRIFDVNNGFVLIGTRNDISEDFRNLYLYKPDQPTAVNMSALKATPANKEVKLNWKTESEMDIAGFNVWRAEGFKKVNEALIPAEGSPLMGADYDFFDRWAMNGKLYYYLVEDMDNEGISTFHGPVKAVPRWWYGVGR